MPLLDSNIIISSNQFTNPLPRRQKVEGVRLKVEGRLVCGQFLPEVSSSVSNIGKYSISNAQYSTAFYLLGVSLGIEH
jgi:hypothetical protein